VQENSLFFLHFSLHSPLYVENFSPQMRAALLDSKITSLRLLKDQEKVRRNFRVDLMIQPKSSQGSYKTFLVKSQ
jgi:hypothetical protein